MVLDRKHQVLREVLTADLTRLTGLFVDICERHRRYRDYTRYELSQALREVLASFPVYRTYIRPGDAASWQDLRHVVESVEAARARRTDLDPELFGFLEGLLLLQVPIPESDAPVPPEIELVMRFQQLSGPVMAKGVEDTSFYNYNRFVALNEVGGDPGRFGLPVDEFHEACRLAQECYPISMLDTSTHDTKRSRGRAGPAGAAERDARGLGGGGPQVDEAQRRLPGDGLVDRNIEYLLYQVLVGAWPLTKDRGSRLRPEGVEGSQNPHLVAGAERRLRRGAGEVRRGYCSTTGRSRRCLPRSCAPLIAPGRVNSLSQTLLKLTAPGVPDLYQGTELWDLSLVDPDNRRPVDYAARTGCSRDLDGMKVQDVLAREDEGLPKLFLIRRALKLRRQLPEAVRRRGELRGVVDRAGEGRQPRGFHPVGRGGDRGSPAGAGPPGRLGQHPFRAPGRRMEERLYGEKRSRRDRRPVAHLLARFPGSAASPGVLNVPGVGTRAGAGRPASRRRRPPDGPLRRTAGGSWPSRRPGPATRY